MSELRDHKQGDFSREEVTLANRNSGIALEMLRYDVTPVGMHYLLTHFDYPYLEADTWKLEIGGLVDKPVVLTLADLKALPQITQTVTLECAGNGRANIDRRYQSMPWQHEAVSTAKWTGVRLSDVLDKIEIDPSAIEIVFYGADHGEDAHGEHDYGRSLSVAHAMQPEVMLVYEMNDLALLPQHGAPVRMIVPGWYGMASVKWLTRIEAIDQAFDGPQQTGTYVFRDKPEDPGTFVQEIRVKSLMVPPGFPDFYSRRRFADAGQMELLGRAWSGNGVAISRVEIGVDGVWHDAVLTAPDSKYAWTRWHWHWDATPGEHVLQCRATDANGQVQPLDARWDNQGFGNNGVHSVKVTVR
ncbi:MAG: sulfite oxidase [Anderseniella sp.]